MFSVTRRIMLSDTDAAGLVYFARYLAMAHDAYEEFLASRRFDFRRAIREASFIVPVIHSESSHHLPLRLAEQATISVHIAEINRRTFHVEYEIRNGAGALAARCKTVHAAVDKATGKAIRLPDVLVELIK